MIDHHFGPDVQSEIWVFAGILAETGETQETEFERSIASRYAALIFHGDSITDFGGHVRPCTIGDVPERYSRHLTTDGTALKQSESKE